MYESTADRLEAYYEFMPEVVDRVAQVAQEQLSFETYRDYLGSVGIHNLDPSSILDIRRPEEEGVLVVHLPMANPLDPNMLFQIATIASTLPNKRIIAPANPAGGSKYALNLLNRRERRVVASGDFSPVSAIVERYLDSHGVDFADHVGYSYGADLAVSSANMGGHEVGTVIVIDPASVVARGVINLGRAFKSTEEALEGYVNASNLQIFLDARTDSVSDTDYIKGLLRLSNVAVTRGIARGNIFIGIDKALSSKNAQHVGIVWGSESELAIDAIVLNKANRLVLRYGSSHVSKLRLPGQKHALTNDVHLQSAIVTQVLL